MDVTGKERQGDFCFNYVLVNNSKEAIVQQTLSKSRFL